MLLAWMWLCCYVYGVHYPDALATALVEARPVIRGECVNVIRVGPIGHGKYYGPMGINRCFSGADDPKENIRLGVRALGRYPSLEKSLRKYNATFNYAYYREICKWSRVIESGWTPQFIQVE